MNHCVCVASTDKKFLTASERICVYLDNFQSYEDHVDGPIDLTQIGIACAVGVARSNVARALLPLLRTNKVECSTVHIPGFRQKRIIYYLQPLGRHDAKKLREKVMKTKIRAIGLDGSIIVDYPEAIRAKFLPNVPIADLLYQPFDNQPFNCKTFLRARTKNAKMSDKQVLKESGSKHFFGRDGEVTSIKHWLGSNRTRTLILRGMPGIGKSTLIANVMEYLTRHHNVIFINVNPWSSSLRSLVLSLGDIMGDIGSDDLRTYLAEHPTIEMFELEYILTRSLMNKKVIFIFDNVQNAGSEIKMFFHMLKNIVDTTSGIKLILMGRDVDIFHGDQITVNDSSTLSITLGELNSADASSLAKSYLIPEERLNNVLTQAGGHPLFVELLASGDKSNRTLDIERYINEAFVNTLDKDEYSLLKFLSVFRFPVERNAIRSNQPAMCRLLQKSILKQSDDDYVIMHDMLKDSFYRQLSATELRRHHSKAAEYYLESLNGCNSLESVHHLLLADRADSAAELMVLKAETLLKTANMELLASTLTKLLSREMQIRPQDRAILLYAQGTALAFIGEVDSALGNFNRSIELVADNNNPVWVKNKMGIAEIMLSQNKYEESEALYRAVLEWAKEHNAFEIEAEANYQLGAIYERLGVPEQALKHFNSAWALSLPLNDKKQLAQALWGIGRIYHVGLKFEKALKGKNEALDIALKIGNEHLASKILTSIGGTLSKMGCLDEAIDANNRAIGLARKSGAIRVLAYTLSNAGAGYIDKPDLIQASKYLEEALFLFEKLGERRMIASVKLNIAVILVLRGHESDGSKSFMEVRKRMEALNDKGALLNAYFKFGQAMKKVEQSTEAMKLLKKALQISREIGDSDASEQILREMQDLLNAA